MDPAPLSARPALDDVRTEDDLRRWYWLRSELVELARRVGTTASGSKVELTERLAATLAGRPTEPAPRRTTTTQLAGPLDGSTVIPAGQRCSQELRAWFTEAIGPGFRFDGPMRAFVSAGGATLDQAVEHWHRTRDRERADIAPQFEYNRFTRDWRAAHPDGDRAVLLAAWWAHRSAPRHEQASVPQVRGGVLAPEEEDQHETLDDDHR